jgi:hypothetical protein
VPYLAIGDLVAEWHSNLVSEYPVAIERHIACRPCVIGVCVAIFSADAARLKIDPPTPSITAHMRSLWAAHTAGNGQLVGWLAVS